MKTLTMAGSARSCLNEVIEHSGTVMAPTGVANAASTPYRWAIHLFSTAMARSTQRSIGHDAFPSGNPRPEGAMRVASVPDLVDPRAVLIRKLMYRLLCFWQPFALVYGKGRPHKKNSCTPHKKN